MEAIIISITQAFFSALGDVIYAILDALGFIVNIISNATSALGSLKSALPTFVIYFLSSLHLEIIMNAVILAYITRFLIRRIPFIG